MEYVSVLEARLPAWLTHAPSPTGTVRGVHAPIWSVYTARLLPGSDLIFPGANDVLSRR